MTDTIESFEIDLVPTGESEAVAFVTNKLTTFQIQEVAKLFRNSDLEGLINSIFSENEDNGPTGIDIGIPFIKTLVEFVANEHLVDFLVTVLVPKETLKWRKEMADKIREPVGDLSLTQVKAIISNFFTRNVTSELNLVNSLSIQQKTVTETE